MKAINLKEKLGKFDELWTPKIIAQMNDYHFKLAKFHGEFTWHDHRDSDEVFYVLSGSMRIDFREYSVKLNEGEMYVVPKGLEHKPYSKDGCSVLLVEPGGTVNTGESGGELTAPNDTWI